MNDWRRIHVGSVGEAPIAFYERDVACPECPWGSLGDIFRALAFPEDRDAAVIASMSSDYVGAVLRADGDTVLIAHPVVGELVRAARAIGKQFDSDAWCWHFSSAAEDALDKILLRLPSDYRDIYAETARANTWGGWS